jgi:hypothetical protein
MSLALLHQVGVAPGAPGASGLEAAVSGMAELSAENMATPYGKIDEAARPYLSNRLIAKKM